MLSRVHDARTGSENTDRPTDAVPGQDTSMRRSVDATGKTGHHADAGRGKGKTEFPGKP